MLYLQLISYSEFCNFERTQFFIVLILELLCSVFGFTQDLANIGPSYDSQKQMTAITGAGGLNGKTHL